MDITAAVLTVVHAVAMMAHHWVASTATPMAALMDIWTAESLVEWMDNLMDIRKVLMLVV
jgi:hypothetical protein